MKRIKAKITSFSKTDLYLILGFVIASLVSFYLRYRLLPVFSQDPVAVLAADADSSSYLRMFDLAISRFPDLPSNFDYYSSYPWGFKYVIPAVWSYLLAALSIPMAAILRLEPAQAAGFIALILGLAATIPIYFLARELFGRKVALVTAMIALFHPDFVEVANTGLDHHVADLFLVPSVYALFFLSKKYFIEGRTRAFAVSLALSGTAAALSVLMSLSLILIVPMILLPVFIAVFLMPKDEIRPALVSLCGLFGASALLLGLLALITPWFSSSFEFKSLSLLHIAVFGAISMVCGIGLIILKAGVSQSIFEAIAAVAIVAVAGTVYAVPQLYQVLLKGFYRSIGSYPLGKETLELKPLLEPGIGQISSYFSYLFYISPIVIIGLAIKDWKSNKIKFEHLFFYVMFFALGFYTFQASYYSNFFSLFLVIAYGLGVVWMSQLLYSNLRFFKLDHLGKLGENRFVVSVTVIAITIAVFTAVDKKPVPAEPNFVRLAEFIKTNTPKPGIFSEPTKKPSYGIMCQWSRSFQLEYLSQRATVSTGNHETGLPGIIASEKFYQATSEEEGLKALKDLNVKYVVGDKLFTIWLGDISKIGEPSAEPEKVATADPEKLVRALKQEELNMDTFEESMATRLSWDALEPPLEGKKEPLHHFRLLYISNAEKDKSPFMLYGVVKGARITVKSASDKPVSVWTKVHTNSGQVLPWRVMGRTDKSGEYSTIVPYPTGAGKSPTKAETYRVQVGYLGREVDVDEKAVLNGDEVILRF